MIKVAVFASGSGSNAENLIRYFHNHPEVEIAAIYTNNPDAFVLKRTEPHGIPGRIISKNSMSDGSLLKELSENGISLVVLAGFLKLVPAVFINGFPGQIINLHPSLLPKYGGKGMHGMHVHEAVIAAGEKCSGITIHHVNDHYDEGTIIDQFVVELQPNESPESLSQKIHELEMKNLPMVVEKLALGR